MNATPPPRRGLGASGQHPPEVERGTAAMLSLRPAAAPAAVSLAQLKAAGIAVLTHGSRSRIKEEFTVCQQQVYRAIQAAEARQDHPPAQARVVLITSARPGEGKTFTALNLAASFALGGALPVVLVDVDGKPGSLGQLLGIADRPGLRQLAADPARPPTTALLPTELPGLVVLGYGARPVGDEPGPPGGAMAAAVLRVAAAMPGHAVILDAPPCLSTSDPSTLAAVAGQVVLVVEAERTQQNEVEAALDMVEICPSLQLMLNKARLTGRNTFGTYASG